MHVNPLFSQEGSPTEITEAKTSWDAKRLDKDGNNWIWQGFWSRSWHAPYHIRARYRGMHRVGTFIVRCLEVCHVSCVFGWIGFHDNHRFHMSSITFLTQNIWGNEIGTLSVCLCVEGGGLWVSPAFRFRTNWPIFYEISYWRYAIWSHFGAILFLGRRETLMPPGAGEQNGKKNKTNSMFWVRERTIPVL
jgi:hypothetical protein